MANRFGDATARRQGRMTLNPIHHLDPIGSLMILLVGFGWAKPVPINPLNFNQYRSGLRWVSFAGPMSNLVFAFFALLLYSILLNAALLDPAGLFNLFMVQLIMINIFIAIFNLIPIPPLDGSKILMSFLSDANLGLYRQIERYSILISLGVIGLEPGGLANLFMGQLIMINIYIAIFNLIPIPPLDGSKILMSFLSDANLVLYRQIERYAPLILIALIIIRIPGLNQSILGMIVFPLANGILTFYNLIIGMLMGF